MDEGIILYSQQFVPPDVPDFGEEEVTEEERAEFTAWCKRQRKALKETTYTPIPGRMETAREFVTLAETVSRRYRISMEIKQYPGDVKVTISTGRCVFSGKLLHQLAQLLGMCDRVITFCPGDDFGEHIVFLELCTHKEEIK